MEYFQEAIDVAIHPKEKYESATDGVSLMQEGRSSASLTARRVGQRVDRPTRQWLEEAIADFRQIVDQGSGRVAPWQLLQLLQLGCDDTPMMSSSGRRWMMNGLLRFGRGYPVVMEDWVNRVAEEMHRCAREYERRRLRAVSAPASVEPDPALPFGIQHAAHVWRDGTWSSRQDLIDMGREDFLGENQTRLGSSRWGWRSLRAGDGRN